MGDFELAQAQTWLTAVNHFRFGNPATAYENWNAAIPELTNH
jgi:hypothetical protein